MLYTRYVTLLTTLGVLDEPIEEMYTTMASISTDLEV